MLKIPDIKNPRNSYGGGKIISELHGLYCKKIYKKFVIFRPIMFMVKIWVMNMLYLSLFINLKS